MNKGLTALMTKLTWQCNGIDQELQTLSRQLAAIEQQIQEITARVAKASVSPSVIIPEREIAGLHFIMAQQQQLDQLHSNRTELLSQQDSLLKKKIRLNTELKMLEKYLENQQKDLDKKELTQRQHQADEWVLQRRKV